MPNPPRVLLRGARFGKWTVVGYVGSKGKKKVGFHKCLCDCGFVAIVRTNRLLRGESTGCRKSQCNSRWKGGVDNRGSYAWARSILSVQTHHAKRLGYVPPRCTPEEAARMFNAAGGKCESCGQTPRKICLDHCHETGVMRGVICDRCNRVVGWVGESQRIVNCIMRYITKRCIQRQLPLS
jgi:hypothetical protein